MCRETLPSMLDPLHGLASFLPLLIWLGHPFASKRAQVAVEERGLEFQLGDSSQMCEAVSPAFCRHRGVMVGNGDEVWWHQLCSCVS